MCTCVCFGKTEKLVPTPHTHIYSTSNRVDTLHHHSPLLMDVIRPQWMRVFRRQLLSQVCDPLWFTVRVPHTSFPPSPRRPFPPRSSATTLSSVASGGIITAAYILGETLWLIAEGGGEGEREGKREGERGKGME